MAATVKSPTKHTVFVASKAEVDILPVYESQGLRTYRFGQVLKKKHRRQQLQVETCLVPGRSKHKGKSEGGWQHNHEHYW